jgi:hypothetical protein
LTWNEFDTRYVAIAARVLVDPQAPADVAAANAVQQGLALSAGSAEPFVMPDYDEGSFTGVRNAVLALANYMSEDGVRFGRKDEVDRVLHLLGTAAGGTAAQPSRLHRRAAERSGGEVPHRGG